jgi:hypothetical protein
MAKEVISWIGKSSYDSSKAMAVLKKTPSSKPSGAESVTQENLENLFARPYWKRVWIIQEVAVASNVKIICGQDEITWDELDAADDVYGGSTLQKSLGGTNYTYIKEISIFRGRYRTNEPLRLFDAIFRTRNALSMDPRDKIFALLGLCYDSSNFVPLPNYDQPIEELFQDLTRKLMRMYRSLDFVISDQPHFLLEPRTSSWTPNWLGP